MITLDIPQLLYHLFAGTRRWLQTENWRVGHRQQRSARHCVALL